MGPGLFLAIALALLAGPAAAERSVGLDAKGVDPMVAVDNRWGLDVRDEMGRPVSGEKVLTELKQAAVARTVANAFASKLAGAASFLSAVELLQAGKVNLRELGFSLPHALASAGLPGPRPKVSAVLIAMMAILAITHIIVRPRPAALALKSGRCCPEVLRC